MTTSPYRLSSPPPPPAESLARRAGRWLLRTWRGRVLLAALAVHLSGEAGLPWHELLRVLAAVTLFCYATVGAFVACVRLARRLLFRIRTKLLVSYLFIAVVPLVLLTVFFLIAGALFAGLSAADLVEAELRRHADVLRTAGRAALAGLAPGDPGAAKALAQRLAPLLARHPQAAYVYRCAGGPPLVGGAGRPAAGLAELPAWWQGQELAGLVLHDENETLRAVVPAGPCVLLIDVPVSRALFRELEQRSGIRVLSAGSAVESHGAGLRVEVSDGDFERLRSDPAERLAGWPFMATTERIDWRTGERGIEALTFLFRPQALRTHLSAGSLDITGILVRALLVVGAFFLVMYAVAVLLGLLLARSITGSVHALHQGTLRLRSGDFDTPIRVRSRDQLGELAASFNQMTAAIKQALFDQAEKQRLEEELRIARQIQMSLLPQQMVSLPGLRVSALCLPAAEVGGDYYDLLPLGPTRLAVVVADVSGKGTSAALYMAELKGLVLSLSRIYSSPARLMAELNRILAVHTDSRTFVTMTYAVLDLEAGRMCFARAGHNPLLHFEAATGRARLWTPPGMGLGIDRGPRFEETLQEQELPLRAGDTFLFFTDGLSEAMNVHAELFGERRLRDLLERADTLGTEELKDAILAEVRRFVGDEAQHDDMTLVALKVV